MTGERGTLSGVKNAAAAFVGNMLHGRYAGRSIHDVALDCGLDVTAVKRSSAAAGFGAVWQLFPQR